MAEEVELKLFFPAEARAEIEAHRLIAGAQPQGGTETLDNTYFDTDDLALHGAGIALRTRRMSSGCLQTVKCAARSVAGLSCRPEWERDFAGDFDFSAIEADTVRQFLETKKSALKPVFTTRVNRRTWQAEPRAGVRILIMLDSGTILAAGEERPISELELELVQGNAMDLRDFAIELAADLPLIPFDQSKSERGYQLFRKEPARPQKAGKTPVTAGMTSLHAFQALALQAQQAWQANLHGALATADPEFVHQFRVALRRLNTLMRVFRPALPERFSADWSSALKELAGVTGEVRDLDVMRQTILLPLLDSADSADHQALMRKAIAACDAARDAADSAFDRLLNGVPLLRFARDMADLPDASGKKTMAAFAEKRLARLHGRAATRLFEVVRQPTPQASHRLRIALKNLRYSCDFFCSLYDEAAMLLYARHVAALQDELGFINDLHVALSRLDQWSQHDATLGEARDHIASCHAGRLDAQLATALARAEALLGQCLPWCGACERHGMTAVRDGLRQGISINFPRAGN